jgi:hypothetical protein
MSGAEDAIAEARRRLLGAWELLEFEDRESPTGPWSQTYGPNPSGLIVYDPSGTVSTHVPPAGSISEYVAYYGRFEVVEARRSANGLTGIVEHRMESASTPWLMEEEPPRAFEVAGDRLILGDQLTARRVLERRPARD